LIYRTRSSNTPNTQLNPHGTLPSSKASLRLPPEYETQVSPTGVPPSESACRSANPVSALAHSGFPQDTPEATLTFQGYVDSDWGSDRLAHRRSISGVFMLAGQLYSTRQGTNRRIALSSTEAEIRVQPMPTKLYLRSIARTGRGTTLAHRHIRGQQWRPTQDKRPTTHPPYPVLNSNNSLGTTMGRRRTMIFGDIDTTHNIQIPNQAELVALTTLPAP
jgi:hypothetical protein